MAHSLEGRIASFHCRPGVCIEDYCILPRFFIAPNAILGNHRTELKQTSPRSKVSQLRKIGVENVAVPPWKTWDPKGKNCLLTSGFTTTSRLMYEYIRAGKKPLTKGKKIFN